MRSEHRSRYRFIAETLARHSLGFVLGLTGLDRFVPFHRGALGHEPRPEPYATPEHVRLALEELGPTFIKLGQLLSTRPDLVPPNYAEELAKLQDAAPPVPSEDIRRAIRQELGVDPEELFSRFDIEPLAAASIGQAHTARLHDGTEVVVKIRRPGVVARVEEDLDILQNLAVMASRRSEQARSWDLSGLAREFATTLRRELDYLQEGDNAERFGRNFAGTDVIIPRVFWETTTSRMLTLERMHGTKIDDLATLAAAGVDRTVLARRGADLVLTMIFDHRFFHADPHPGNMFVQADGTIALIDFGMVGVLDEQLQEQLTDFFLAFTAGDPDALATALVEMCIGPGPVDRERLRRSLPPLIALYHGRRLGEIKMGELIMRLFALLREQHLHLPPEMAGLFRVLVMVEGLGMRLDPDFDLIEVLTPYAQRLMRERMSPLTLAKRFAGSSLEAGALLLDLPAGLRRLLNTMDEGVPLHLRAAELDPLVGRMERIGNRLVVGMVVSALVVGIGELVSSERRWRSWEGAMLGAGMGTISTLGGYLLWTARRRNG